MNPRKFVVTYIVTRSMEVSTESYTCTEIDFLPGAEACTQIKSIEEDNFDALLVFDSPDAKCMISVFELLSTDKKP